MSKFDALLDAPSYERHECIALPQGVGLLDCDHLPGSEWTREDWLAEARYWRTKTARAHLAYSKAYWDYDLCVGMEQHCLFAANLNVVE